MPPFFPPAGISRAQPWGNATWREIPLSAARIAAVQADVAALLMRQGCGAAVRALAHPGGRRTLPITWPIAWLAGAGGELQPRLDRLGDARRIVGREEPDLDQVA